MSSNMRTDLKHLVPRWRWWVTGGVIVFFVILVVEQAWRYQWIRSQIGEYAYSSPFALRQLGKEGEYIGQVVDMRWNIPPLRPDDVKGLQPRYLIARETVPGVTEEQWWCAYLFVLSPEPPAQYKPSPFPKLTLLPHAVQ